MPDRPSCYDRALALLARRPHFAAELRRKLEQRGYPPSELDSALERLRAAGYVDDQREARSFVRQRRARSPVGRRRLQAELARRGVDAEVVSAALADLSDDDDLEAARQAALRFAGGGGGSRAALARHLERRGFASRAILAVLDEHDLEAAGADEAALDGVDAAADVDNG